MSSHGVGKVIRMFIVSFIASKSGNDDWRVIRIEPPTNAGLTLPMRCSSTNVQGEIAAVSSGLMSRILRTVRIMLRYTEYSELRVYFRTAFMPRPWLILQEILIAETAVIDVTDSRQTSPFQHPHHCSDTESNDPILVFSLPIN